MKERQTILPEKKEIWSNENLYEIYFKTRF